MVARILAAGIVFSLAHLAAASDVPLPDADSPSGDMTPRDDRQAQRDLYDALRAASSPRQQSLAGRVYLGDDETPSALRPKREDVVAQAARSAPQDAFVQWMAADAGSYTSSQCGPTRWPVAEVAKLVRLEPGNAGAWQYAVALAQVKHDDEALDEALARMASADRADDHLGDEIAEWRTAYTARPGGNPSGMLWNEAPVGERALLGALQQTAYRSTPTDAALEAACKPDGDSERTWRRLGWCVDAGMLLAGKGNSFALRETGLKMLAAAGATPSDLADLQRQHGWLAANAANPMRNPDAFRDAPADVVSDWRDAKSEIAAAERRLARLGKPATPPAGWDAKRQDAEQGAETDASERSWTAYSHELLDAMGADADPRMRVLALASAPMRAMLGAAAAGNGDGDGAATDATTALADFAAAHADDAFVQWIAASQGDAHARANLQRLEPGNAAAWALSIDDATLDRAQTLQRMASSTRYTLHLAEAGAVWLAAAKKYPPPADLDPGAFMESASSDAPSPSLSDDDRAAMVASMFAFMTAIGGSGPYATIAKVCAETSPACTAIGRILSDRSDTLIGTRIGLMLLRKQHAMTADDVAKARRLDWWQAGMRNLSTPGDMVRYLRDALAHGETEALRLAMQRAGRLEPPANWKSPSEEQAPKP